MEGSSGRSPTGIITWAGISTSDGAITIWQSGQVLGEQLTWLWQTTPTVITASAAMSVMVTATRQMLFCPDMFEAYF